MQKARLLTALIVAILVIAPVVMAIAGRGLAAPAPVRIEVKAREFLFDPKELSARPVEVTFAVKNEGSIEHNFIIEDANRRTVAQIPVIEVGKTEELKVTLRPGTYTIACNLPGHKDAGMIGTLKVQP